MHLELILQMAAEGMSDRAALGPVDGGYTFACPESGFGSPADIVQAVVQHRSAGVTHVVPLTGGGSFNSYTETAERQGYRPRYGITDFNAIVNTAGLEPPTERQQLRACYRGGDVFQVGLGGGQQLVAFAGPLVGQGRGPARHQALVGGVGV